jgi:hypothetical protein
MSYDCRFCLIKHYKLVISLSKLHLCDDFVFFVEVTDTEEALMNVLLNLTEKCWCRFFHKWFDEINSISWDVNSTLPSLLCSALLHLTLFVCICVRCLSRFIITESFLLRNINEANEWSSFICDAHSFYSISDFSFLFHKLYMTLKSLSASVSSYILLMLMRWLIFKVTFNNYCWVQ